MRRAAVGTAPRGALAVLATSELQIFKAIIRSVAVFVVDGFGTTEGAV